MRDVAVVVILGLIGLWWVATHGKGTAPGRLVAWLVAAAVLWGAVALKNPRAAGSVAEGVATGLDQAVSGIGQFISLI